MGTAFTGNSSESSPSGVDIERLLDEFDSLNDHVQYLQLSREFGQHLRQAIEQHHQVEQACRCREQLFRALVENALDVIARFDRGLHHLYINPAIERVTGQPPSFFLGKTHRQMGFLSVADCDLWEAKLREAFDTQLEVTFEFTFHSLLGLRFHQVRLVPEKNAVDDRVETVMCIGRDLTAAKLAEQSLRQSEERFRTVFEAGPLGMALIGPEHRIVQVNASLCRMLGYTAAELTARRVEDITHPDDVQASVELLEQLTHGPTLPGPIEKRYIRKDGSVLWGRLTPSLIHTPSGEIRNFLGMIEDITERKEAEESLREANGRFRSLLDNVPLVAVGLDRHGKVTYVNPALVKLTGYAMEELLGVDWFQTCIPERDRIALRAIFAELVEAGRYVHNESLLLAKSGQEYLIAWNNTVFLGENGQPMGIACIGEDITERRRAETQLKENEERFRYILKYNPNAIAVLDKDLRYLMVSDRFLRDYNVTDRDIIGKSHYEVFPELPAKWKDIHRRCLTGVVEGADEDSFVRPDGSIDYVRWECRPWYDAQGNVGGVILYTEVITERKRAEIELRRAKEELEMASRTKDQFLAVLSHELRTPLTPILTNMQLMEMDPALSPAHRESIEMVRRNVELEARLIDDLLDLTRISRGKLELHLTKVDLHEVLRQTVQICDSDIRSRRLKLTVEPIASNPLVKADATRLQQVLWNLLKNAVKFTGPGGAISIRTENRADRIVLSIRDTGIGIEPQVLSRLFNAFEQGGRDTTRQFGGLGLGLAISKGIVDLHGGSLNAQSEGSGKGATFILELRSEPPEAPPATRLGSEVAAATAAEGAHVLLVEDHADTARTLSRLLRSYGYDVRVARDVASALRAAAAERFDLLLSDIGLPDGSGLDLMRQLHRTQRLKGIALSGYGMEEDVRRSLDAGFLAHLTKPINLEQLRAAIAQAMADR
ncbi:MAG: PAS domain S-box protein [Bacillota bacterium]